MKQLVLLFTLITSIAVGQQKTFTMEDAVLNQHRNLAPKRLQQLQWIPESNSFSYVEKKEEETQLILGNAEEDDKAQSVLTLSTLNEKLSEIDGPKCRRFPSLTWIDATIFTFEDNQNVYRFNLSENKVEKTDSLELPAKAENRDYAPNTGHIAYTVENNLYILKGDEVVAVSVNKNKGIVSGQTVSRSEFGITHGIFWSPDGTKLAYYVKDESEVTGYPIVDWTTKPATVEYIKYPMAGTDKTEKISVNVYDVNSGKTTTLKTGEPNTQYLTNVAWGPKSEKIYIAHLNRDQNHMELKIYDALNSDFEKVLFEEKSERYVEPQHPVHFVKGNDDQFIWESSRSGFNHLYLYNTKGKLVKQITKGNWEVTGFEGFDKDGKNVFYTSTATSPLNRDLYKVSIKGGKPTRLTANEGTHMPKLNDAGTYFIDNFSSTEVPWRSQIIGTNNKVNYTLIDSDNPLTDYKLGEMNLFTIKDKDGGDLYCRMYLPTDFDSTKTYPVIVYLYGGPHAQMIRNYWGGGGNLWYQYMAQRGFIVWTLDNRGSGNRGQAWEQNTFRQLGTVEMEDQMQGLEYLKSKSYVDTNRMGIHGWSFGGFMTMSMMSRNPGVFKAGVAGGPVIDWSFYEVMYTERYMDTPEQNPEGFEASNLINHIDDLEGKLLIIHGSSDDVVVWQHTQMYLKAAVEKGKQVDYFDYPMHKHNVRGKDRVHLMQKVTDYFMDYLK
ncbi:dipeptidyl aminopeptidase/acylaminoacyl peptidase [Owenweeksia hongkongensis DSM 17368]|uniref:Dipeptidyl aminopeptidase/acylaminoacyl peptidase n=1 Tax=Owenweeksia hongkongensis (strain DSM 17368 / CIP 108786 / JCM 12287 / NRRL B-23963 / UST20020801) TaxID=926562 RepID=G8R0B2_OWEHD|nr:DPP IV N-terminal domain-containing protein [Owenweeksia hongkongensis]AEV31572.1 dipeptidyl aminopeptidase/acylaminoacyl peptidase [Owenweeksia hongkongensis DSM 17368]